MYFKTHRIYCTAWTLLSTTNWQWWSWNDGHAFFVLVTEKDNHKARCQMAGGRHALQIANATLLKQHCARNYCFDRAVLTSSAHFCDRARSCLFERATRVSWGTRASLANLNPRSSGPRVCLVRRTKFFECPRTRGDVYPRALARSPRVFEITCGLYCTSTVLFHLL